MATAIAEESLVTLTFATSQMPGLWFELRDATLSVILVLFHFSLLRFWRHWRLFAWRKAPEPVAEPVAAETVERCDTAEEGFYKQVLLSHSKADFSAAAAVFHVFGEETAHFHQAPALLLRSFRLAAPSDGPALWELYQATKDHLEYSRAMYSLVISLLCQTREVDQSMEVLRDMILQDVLPDCSCYGPVICAHLARGDLESSVQLLSQMQRQHITPDLATFQAVLEMCCQRQLVLLAEELLLSMEKNAVAPQSCTLAAMVRLYGKTGDLGKAFQIFREMPKKFGFKVDSSAFSSMLCMCAAEGEISYAFQIYEEMLAAGYEADTTSFKALLSGCLQQGDLDTASRLLSDVSAPSGELLELFLLQCARRGRPQLAWSILEEAQRSGVLVSQRVVNSLRR